MKVTVPILCNRCNKTFYGPRMSVAAIRDRNHLQEMLEFYASLKKHLADQHADVMGEILSGEGEFDMMMVLCRFNSNDPELQRLVDRSRWHVHQNTLANKISDQEIAASVEAITPELVTLAASGDTLAISTRLAGLLTFMRDQLQEPNKYDLSSALVEASGLPVVKN